MSLHTSDLTRSDEEILIDMINFDNGTQYRVGDFMFGVPEAIVNIARNTRIHLTGVAPFRTTGETSVTYNRVNIDELPGIERLSVYVQDKVDFSDLIPTINKTLGINLTEGGFVNEPLPSFEGAVRGTQSQITLVITEDNPIYLGRLTFPIFI